MRAFRDMARRGALILFEGVDRCGKTTQARKLAEALNASEPGALFMRFPGAGALATTINDVGGGLGWAVFVQFWRGVG